MRLRAEPRAKMMDGSSRFLLILSFSMFFMEENSQRFLLYDPYYPNILVLSMEIGKILELQRQTVMSLNLADHFWSDLFAFSQFRLFWSFLAGCSYFKSSFGCVESYFRVSTCDESHEKVMN